MSPRPVPRMQRFTRLEDLADLEDLTVRLPATTSTLSSMSCVTSTASHSRPSGEHAHGNMGALNDQDERTRQYIEAHTTFLNSADTEASASRTPVHYPSSLAEDEGYTAPGTPHSFLSSPSLGYYSHPSRPSSQTGYWLDQGTSSLNLIMPSSAMFIKSREPTVEGDKLGFVKLMVAGQSRVWNSRLIQDMFRWEGIIANDFDDEFLQDPLPESDVAGTAAVAQGVGGAGGGGGGSGGGGVSSSNESSSFLEENPGHRRKREYPHQGVREAIVEHYASSMVLPAWARAGFDEQELHQEILVKNVCIVDTPGYSAFSNPNRAMDLVISYLGLQFQTTHEFFSRSAVSDDSLGRFLANNTTGAHSHVDACLYVIEGHLSEIDVQFMQRLQPWVNLIPVLIPPANMSLLQQVGTDRGQDVIMGTSSASSSAAAAAAAAEMIAGARLELIRQLKEHEIHIYGIDHDSLGGSHVPHTTSSSNSSPFTTAESPEADLSSPPLLVLDSSHQLSPEFTSPPFIFHVPPSLVDNTRVGQLDRDVLQLDVTKTDKGDEDSDSDNSHHSTSLPTVPQHRPSSALGVQEDLPDLGPLRRWVYVSHLAALRHHTTQKFLSWRRHLPSMAFQSPMESSQDSGSYRQQRRHHLYHPQLQHQHHGQHGQHSQNTLSSDSGPGSYIPARSTATQSPPPSIFVTQHHHQHGAHPLQQQHPYQRALPTDLLGDLRAQDQRRISDKVVKMLETHGQVFERILQERQVAWRRALEGMEREQRIEFLMQELRRWANEGPTKQSLQSQQQGQRLDVHYRDGSLEPEWSIGGGGGGGGGGTITVGLGLETTGLWIGGEPSLRDALSEPAEAEVSNSVRSTTATDRKGKGKGRGKHQHSGEGGGGRGGGRERSKKSRSSATQQMSKMSTVSQSDEEMDNQEEDPLGLGLWMSRLFGAIGRGLVHVVVMVGMGSFATWIYTHFLEHRITWIG
ncbi:hypothetical protein BGX33_008567 [Mortierella sp. NVP41]|nr:hypothetical protein BGX33_008567 [Mortierella sp. NVP41]